MYYVYVLQLEDGHYYTGCIQGSSISYKKSDSSVILGFVDAKKAKLLFYVALHSQKEAKTFEKILRNSTGFVFRNKKVLCNWTRHLQVETSN